ncbi:MAG: QueT transporter family protein [Clostridia bacterium]|nr:QueT transporter family protein [Clostridia bacterium]
MKKTKTMTQAALIAALYVVLTFVANAMGLASGAIQIRLSEALTILPCFTPAAIPGLFIGCLISNILVGSVIWDIVFGSLATLIGAIGTHYLRKRKWLSPLPPIISNTFIVPLILRYAYGILLPLPLMMLTVGIGEIISCGILGGVVHSSLQKYQHKLFKNL